MKILLNYILGHKPKLRDALGINLLFVAEADRVKGQERFARFVHGLDLILKTFGGSGRTKLAGCIDKDRRSARGGCPTDSGDKRSCLSATRPDADGARLVSNT